MSFTHRIDLTCDVINNLLAMCNVPGRAVDGAIGWSIVATIKMTGSMRHVPDFADLLGRESVRINVNNDLMVNFPLLEESLCPRHSR